MRTLKINYLAVLVIVILSQVIPALWYGAFADQWMAYNNLTLDFIEENASTTPYIVAIVNSIFFSLAMAWVFKRMNVKSALDGLKIALIMGFPFALLSTMTTNMFSFRPYELTWIDGGVNLVIFLVAGLILGAWRKYEG